jgi:hypothetical protein
MTMAVCFKCGAMKFGAFCPCQECQALPANEDDLAISLAMTDHYFDMPTLEQMGATIRDGKPVHLDEASKANILASLHESGMVDKLLAQMGQLKPPEAPPN